MMWWLIKSVSSQLWHKLRIYSPSVHSTLESKVKNPLSLFSSSPTYRYCWSDSFFYPTCLKTIPYFLLACSLSCHITSFICILTEFYYFHGFYPQSLKFFKRSIECLQLCFLQHKIQNWWPNCFSRIEVLNRQSEFHMDYYRKCSSKFFFLNWYLVLKTCFLKETCRYK